MATPPPRWRVCQGRATFGTRESLGEEQREYSRNLEGWQKKLPRSAGPLIPRRPGNHRKNASIRARAYPPQSHLNARPPEQLRIICKLSSQKPPFLVRPTHPGNDRFFATVPFSHTTTRSDFIEECWMLTVRRVRDITSSSSRRPASADHGHEATLPENPATIALSGQNVLLSNG
jgi:hypothetical protein